MDITQARLARQTEDPLLRPPTESLVLAYAAVLPVIAGGVAVWIATGRTGALVLHWTITWAGAILCFLAGVRRGLSFRQEGGPTVAQLGSMLCFFTLGAAALFSPWMLASVLVLLAGYGLMVILDPIAARRHEAPRYFRSLRPPQLLLLMAGLVSLLVRVLA